MAYKILSLDGGGSWAMIQARVLLDIYGDIRGHALLRKFDMVIGNSGGSLVLACLCNDMFLSEIVQVFNDVKQRKQVFSKLGFWEKLSWNNMASLTHVLGPRYSTERKLKGLIAVLKAHDHLYKEKKISSPIVETLLNQLPGIIGKNNLQLLIVGYDYFRRRASFFRSNMNSKTDLFSSKYYALPLGHAIHASSNAPVNYFDKPATVDEVIRKTKPSFTKTFTTKSWFWDGAVSGFNNPVLAALVEATTNGVAVQDICVLSIGTGTGSEVVLTDKVNSTDPEDNAEVKANTNNDLVVADVKFSFGSDVKKLATSILGDPPDSATFIAYSIMDPALSNAASLVRINPCLQIERDSNNRYVPPAVYANEAIKFKTLMDLDMDAVEDTEVALIAELCDKFIVGAGQPCLPNQYIRGDANSTHLGYGTYYEAKQKWIQVGM